MADTVFIALQNNPDAQPIIESILEDNPDAVVSETRGWSKLTQRSDWSSNVSRLSCEQGVNLIYKNYI